LDWIKHSLGIDTGSSLKPFTDNSFNVGSTTLRPKTIYAATSFDITNSGADAFEPCNDGTIGTSLNFLAKWNGASTLCAVKAGTSDTDGVIGIVSGGSGTTGNAVVTYQGYAQCSFSTQTFTVPRLTRVQTFFLQQYDASTPPKYSRFSASLHVDFPL
jgi:hypothetical protein